MSEKKDAGTDINENDISAYNRYVRLAECYESALNNMPDSLGDAKENLKGRYRQLESESDGIKAEIVNAPENAWDDNDIFYSVLYRLNLSTDIGSCKKAAGMLREYLTENQGSVMGETLLKVIGEQLED